MNDITRSLRTNRRLASRHAGARPADVLVPRGIADPPSTAADPRARLASRRLDQLVAAAAPGLALLSPRSALATAVVLGRRPPRPAAAPGSMPGGSATRPADRSRA